MPPIICPAVYSLGGLELMWLLIDAYQPDILGELKPHFIERKFFERSNNILIHTQQFTIDYKILINIINRVQAAHNNQSGLKG